MPYAKAEYMDALFFLSQINFFLAIRGGPYMTIAHGTTGAGARKAK